MKSVPRGMVGMLLTTAAIACASGESAPRHTFEVIEENGVPVAVNSSTPKFEGEIFAYQKVVELRPDPVRPDSLLYDPRTFSIGDDGLYYVADAGNQRIAVFGADGRFVRAFGREGDGPGELREPRTVDVEDGIATVRGRKTVRYRTDGTFLDEIRSPPPPAHRTGEGSYVTFDYPQGPRDDGYYYLRIEARVVSESGEELAVLQTRDVRWAKMADERKRLDLHYAATPFALFVPPDEILMGVGDEPILSWFDLRGRLLRRVRVEAEPESVTATDRAAVEEHYEKLIRAAREAGGGPGEQLVESLENDKATLRFADPKAFWRDVTREDPGWLWLREARPDMGVYIVGSPQIVQQQSFLIVDPNGELIGRTSWPPDARRFGSRIVRGHLLTMIPDPVTGETVPTAFRIQPRVDGLAYPGQ